MFKYSKDRVTVSTVLDTRRAKADGNFPVKIQVTFNRQQKYYTTGKNLSRDDWSKLPKAKSRSLVEIREDIESSFNIVREFVRDLTTAGNFSFSELNIRLKGGTAGTVNSAIAAKIEILKAEQRAGTMYLYRSLLNTLQNFAGSDIEFSDVTPRWLQQFENYEQNRGIKQTTIAIRLRSLRSIFSEAKRVGIIRIASDPFGRGKFEIREGEGRKLALTIEQIGMIARYEAPNKRIAKYRDYWMFMYLCSGINAADFIQLKFSNIINGEIYFVRQKTANTTKTRKEICVLITDMMQSIIDRWGNPQSPDNYIFPILTHKEKNAFQKKK